MTVKKRVVVTGLGIFCPLGRSKEEVLAAMGEKRSAIAEVGGFSTEGLSCSLGAEMKGYTPPHDLAGYPLPVQYAAIAARDACADSGLPAYSLVSGQAGLSFATCNSDLTAFEKPRKLVNVEREASFSFPHFQLGDTLARCLGISGPVLTNATACAASGSALAFAYELIAGGYASVMLAGGSDTMSEAVFAGFNVLQALSPKPCAPFGLPYGLNLGEGAAFVLMESLEQALSRGAHIYAELCGYGLSQDAYHITAPHPQGEGVEQAVCSALAHAGVSAEQVTYVNVHGTGTEANDAAELKGLARFFGPDLFSRLYISSSKSYYGHTLGAAAVLEYVTTLIALQENCLPATLHTTELRDGCTGTRLILGDLVEHSPDYFLCINSAFGGHNSALLSRNWENLLSRNWKKQAPTPGAEKSRQEQVLVDEETETGAGLFNDARFKLKTSPESNLYTSRRVVIAGMGLANQFGCLQGGSISGFLPERLGQKFIRPDNKQDIAPKESSFSAASGLQMPLPNYRDEIKGYIGSFYTRRMNMLTQLSIAATHLALFDAGLKIGDEGYALQTGLIYGTTFGSYYGLSRFLAPFFEKGAAHVSTLYFPDTVLNSTPGKVAARLGGIRGYGSTFSAGGNEGLLAAFAAYEIIAGGYQRYCLAGTGDEISDLRSELSRVLGYDRLDLPLTEGSCFLLLTTLEQAWEEKMPVYAELKGFGFSFCPGKSSENNTYLCRAVDMALKRSGITLEQVDFVFYDDGGWGSERASERLALANMFSSSSNRKVPVVSVNNLFGYSFSASSMYHLFLAASSFAGREGLNQGLVVSSSYNHNNIAAVLARVQA